MIITSKRKLTSSVAILCALMILIGIFPMNLFSGKKADAASITLESKYVYLEISNFSDERNNNVYMFVGTIKEMCMSHFVTVTALWEYPKVDLLTNRKVKKFLVQI